jgi:RNA polymerase sigma-70 factor (family 1)
LIESLFQDETAALTSLKSGSEKGLTYLFHQYSVKLFAYAFRYLKSKDLADEIVQETFLRVWKGRERIELAQSFDQYLFKIAKNLIVDSFRKLAKEKAFEVELFAQTQLFNNHTEEEVLYEELKKLTEKAIEQMPKQQRLVFTLSRYGGLSYNQIAEKLDISINTVKVHMLNSLNFLRHHLRGQGDLYLLLIISSVTFG